MQPLISGGVTLNDLQSDFCSGVFLVRAVKAHDALERLLVVACLGLTHGICFAAPCTRLDLEA
ncbi:hypothetical protein E2C01_048082 [Portunus trituberculatus]|uniref:Uncharacterized protein n=1 Tax=Portunus trituberculatus TaxID=210409 RepID=A0A5B7GC98_PORTR|nr:hypothetical protein [Portunus trituberculatus]